MKLATTQRRATRRAAFTLIEVLVVVAILVILAGVGIVAYMRYLEDAKKTQAQLQCKSLAEACEAYYLNPQSGNSYPTSWQDLLVPFGGTGGSISFLKNGQRDITTPWPTSPNPQYQLQVVNNSDGSSIPLVTCTAPDGTPISQFGIGQLAQPPTH
jgi:general secretion pathway protein G